MSFEWVLRRSNGYFVDASSNYGTPESGGEPFIYKVGNLKKVIPGLDEVKRPPPTILTLHYSYYHFSHHSMKNNNNNNNKMMMMMSILTSAISASCSFYSYTPHFPPPSPSFLISLYPYHHLVVLVLALERSANE